MPSLCALGLLPAGAPGRRFDQQPPPLRALLRNRALIAYVAAFAGNTWGVFAVRVWFVAYLAWLLRLPGNQIALPPRSPWSPVSRRWPVFRSAW